MTGWTQAWPGGAFLYASIVRATAFCSLPITMILRSLSGTTRQARTLPCA